MTDPNRAFLRKKHPKPAIGSYVDIRCGQCGYKTAVFRTTWISDTDINCPSCGHDEYWDAYNKKQEG